MSLLLCFSVHSLCFIFSYFTFWFLFSFHPRRTTLICTWSLSMFPVVRCFHICEKLDDSGKCLLVTTVCNQPCMLTSQACCIDFKASVYYSSVHFLLQLYFSLRLWETSNFLLSVWENWILPLLLQVEETQSSEVAKQNQELYQQNHSLLTTKFMNAQLGSSILESTFSSVISFLCKTCTGDCWTLHVTVLHHKW